MDDFDIYDDLQLLQEQGKQKAEEDLQWKEKYHVALGTIENLQAENKELRKKIKVLETNFGSLLDTARAEIKRKNNQIVELRRDNDDLCFRRVTRPGGKHPSNDAGSHRPRHEYDKPYESNKTSDSEKKPKFVKTAGEKSDEPECSRQTHNPFQGESSGRLGSFRSKNDKESHNKQSHSGAISNQHDLSKQQKIEENKNNQIGNIENKKKTSEKENLESVRDVKQDPRTSKESGRNVKDEKVLEEDILRDLKEFKKKKQVDVKKEGESKESTLIASDEKSNVFFDALFDDLDMNEENSKDIYSDLEKKQTEIICDTEISDKKTRDNADSVVEHKLITPQKAFSTKNLDDLFGSSPDDPVEQVNSSPHKCSDLKSSMGCKSEKISAFKFKQELKSLPEVPTSKDFNIISDCTDSNGENQPKPYNKIKIEIPSKGELQPSKESCSFKFEELDSSFYSSEEEKTNEKEKEECSSKNSCQKTSNLDDNFEDSNGIMVTNDPIKTKIGEKHTKQKKLSEKTVGNNAIQHIHKHVSADSKYKSLQTDKQEKTASARHKSERIDMKSKDDIKASSRHNRSSSRSKSHKHEKESHAKVHSGNTSKVGINTNNESMKNKCDRGSQLKYEEERRSKGKKHNLNKNVEEVVKVPSKEIKSLSCIAKVQTVDRKEESSCKKKQQDNIVDSEFDEFPDDETFEKKADFFQETTDRKERFETNLADKCPTREITNDTAMERHKVLDTDHKITYELGNIAKPMCDNIEANQITNEQQKVDAPGIELVSSNNSPLADVADTPQKDIISNTNMLSKDESKEFAESKPQLCTAKVDLLHDEANTNKYDQSKGVSNADLCPSQSKNAHKNDENNVSKHNKCMKNNGVDSKQYSKPSTNDACGSNKLVNLNHDLVTVTNQINHVRENVLSEVASDSPVLTSLRDEISKEIDLKSYKSHEGDADSTIENTHINASPEEKSGRERKFKNSNKCKESGIKLSKAFDVSSNQELVTELDHHAHTKIADKYDASKPVKETTIESDMDENEHIEMPRLLVEEEPEDVLSSEKLTEIKTNSESLETSMLNVTRTENRIHHKKRMLQNSRTMECVSTNIKDSSLNDISSQFDGDKVINISSNHDKIYQKSIPPDSITCNKYGSDKKIGSISSNSDEKRPSSVEKSHSKERYKKKILQKYNDSNDSVNQASQRDSSSSCETNGISTHYNNTNHNGTDLNSLKEENKSITKIANDKESSHTSKHSDLNLAELSSYNKIDILKKCEKSKQVQNTVVVVQCEKRKLPLTTESENLNHSKILKSDIQNTIQKQDKKESDFLAPKEEIGKNLKTNSLEESNISFAPSIDAAEPSRTETRKLSNHSHNSAEHCMVVPTKNINSEQSNEISSQCLVRNEETLNKDACVGKLTKSNIVDEPSLRHVTSEEGSVLYLKRKTKLVPSLKEKKRKRNLPAPNSPGEIEEEKASKSKKPKKMDAQMTKDSKLVSLLHVKNKNKNTKDKNYKSSPPPAYHSDLVNHNIFSNDDCPDDRNLPVICNDKEDAQYQEIDDRMRSMFQSPTYKPSTVENPFDDKCNISPQWNNDITFNHTVDETIKKSEKSQCDTSSSSRKISVGSNDYVIETVGAHVANVFITRKKCKKRRKIATI